MDRVSLEQQSWIDTIVPIFLERFILAVLAAAVIGIFMVNPLKWDRTQQAGAALALVGVALFVAGTAYRMYHPAQPMAIQTTDIPKSKEHIPPPPVPSVSPHEPKPQPTPQLTSPAARGNMMEKPKDSTPNITQRSEGPNSPNVVTLGSNSPVTIVQGLPPWILSSVQQQAIAAAVRPYLSLWDGKFDVIVCNIGDPESIRMAEAFVAAFRAGGWQLPYGGYGQAMSMPAPVGISMNVPGVLGTDQPTPELQRFLEDLANVLRRTGVIAEPLGVGMTPQMPAGRFEIRIGRRPDTATRR